MIFKQKLKDLSEDGLSLLMYCLNDGLSSEEVDLTTVYCMKPEHIFTKLNQFAPLIKGEYRSLLQSVADTVTSK
jgi:hypothetical protein